MVLTDKSNHYFLVCNLRSVFEKVKFDVRRGLEPFKDLDGRFDPSSTALLLYTQLCCTSTFLSKSKSTNRECCMVNLLSGSLKEGQLN